MIIHAHLIVWNEEKILPYALKHYLRFCDRVFIWDNGSTDRTMQIIAEHNQDNKIIVYKFDTHGQFDDMTNIHIKNHCWKLSKGTADYVVVADCDELVWHDDIKTFLKNNEYYTFFVPQWIEMVADEFPDHDGLITDIVKTGFVNPHSKMLLFNPNKVESVNWVVGAHEYKPITKEPGVCYDSSLLTLHCKFLSADYVINRYKITSDRFSAANKLAGFGRHHLASPEEVRTQFNNLKKQSIKVIK